MRLTRLRRTSPANIGPNLFHHSRTVSWQMSIPRLNSRSSTFLRLSGKRTYISTTSRITSGEELKYRNGLAGLRGRGMHPPYPAPSLPAGALGLTEPPEPLAACPLTPQVVAGGANILPAQWRDVGQQIAQHLGTAAAQMPDGAVEIDGVPERAAAVSRVRPEARWRWFSKVRSRSPPRRLKKMARASALRASPLLRMLLVRGRGSGSPTS
jgi:hypothetical protein